MIRNLGDVLSLLMITKFYRKISMLSFNGLSKIKCVFMPKKCKVLSISHFYYNLFSKLPFFLFPYEIDNVLIDYCTEEKDLGIIITDKFDFSNHQQEVLSKAINQFNRLRRTCHFVRNSHKRRTLYLTLVRSLLENGSQIWSPNISVLNKFENFQKVSKWVWCMV